MSRAQWLFLILLRHYRSLGLRVTLYALLSVLAALASPLARQILGIDSASAMQFDSVMPILSILATSMLAVSTFSLNIMVSAYRAAAASTTPRVHRFLLEDTTTQSVLSAFIGAFVYSLSSIILYQVGFYPEDAALLVMGMTIVVVAIVVVSLLRWIQYLTNLGSVDDSLRAVSDRAAGSLADLARVPTFGASALTQDTRVPTDCATLSAPVSGYIQLVDVARLQECLPPHGAIYLRNRPGAYVLKGQMLAQVSGAVDETRLNKLARAFTIGDQRTFEQDPGYGLIVLSEIACKALSPGINDPGTAIAAVHCLRKLLWEHAHETADRADITCSRVFVPAFDHKTAFEAACMPIARDGAGSIEVATDLRRTLAELASGPDPEIAEAARHTAQLTLGYSTNADLLEQEQQSLQRIEV